MRLRILMRNTLPLVLLTLLALTAVMASGSCSGRSLRHFSSIQDEAARHAAADAIYPHTGSAAILRPDAPYAGPYRLPRGRMVYTADTIREYHLEGMVEPGVYVVMHNRVLRFPGVVKDREKLTFTKR